MQSVMGIMMNKVAVISMTLVAVRLQEVYIHKYINIQIYSKTLLSADTHGIAPTCPT